MKKMITCITLIALVISLVIPLSACNSGPSTVQETIKFENTNTVNLNKVYDLGNVKLTIGTINLLDSQGNVNFDAIQVLGSMTVTQDDTYWSLEDSVMTIDSNEKTVPMLLTKDLRPPLNKINNQSFELIAYITTSQLSNIKQIQWHIEEPCIKNADNTFKRAGNQLDITINIIRD